MWSKGSYAPLEAQWSRFEDLAPRGLILGFHSYLRDQEISAGRRFPFAERHSVLLTYARLYPEILVAYRSVYGGQ